MTTCALASRGLLRASCRLPSPPAPPTPARRGHLLLAHRLASPPLRTLSATSARRANVGPPRPPIPPQEQVLRDALSRLTPAQIQALLATPNPQIPPPGGGRAPPSSSSSFFRRLLRGTTAVAFVAFGYLYAQYITIPFDWIEPGSPEWFDDRSDMIKELAHSPYVAAMVADPLWQDILVTQPDAAEDEEYEGFSIHPPPGDPSAGRVWATSDSDASAASARHIRHHYLATTTKYALPVWLLTQHRKTGEIRLIVVFGETSAGWPGIVHGGYQATVMLELMRIPLTMLTTLEAGIGWTADTRLEMQYHSRIEVGQPYVIRIEPQGFLRPLDGSIADELDDPATTDARIDELILAGKVEQGLVRATIEPLTMPGMKVVPPTVLTQAELLWTGSLEGFPARDDLQYDDGQDGEEPKAT